MDFSKVLNLKNILLGIGIFAVVIAMLGFSGKLPGFDNQKANQSQYTGVVKIWGTIPEDSLAQTLEIFNKQNVDSYSVDYKEVREDQISLALITALADGQAPDLILAPSYIILQNSKRLNLIPQNVISEIDFRNIFVDASQILISTQGYLGLPVSVNPLIMYYNRDLLSSAGLTNPPTTWDQFFDYESQITRFNDEQNESLKISTIALGTYNNIPHITDIIMAMILQIKQGPPISRSFEKDHQGNFNPKYKILFNENSNNLEVTSGILNTVLSFMQKFSNPKEEAYNWNHLMPNTLSQFLAGKLAFYIGYASELNYIKSANQKLYFDYTYLPQVAKTNINTTYGKLYTLSMLKNSQNPGAAYAALLNFTTGSQSLPLASATGGLSALKARLVAPSGNQAAVILGHSGLIAKSFYNLYPQKLEALMQMAVESIYIGQSDTVAAEKKLIENLQVIYDGK